MPLHSYDKPPVVETVMGIQFEPVPGFTNGHLGLFWAHLGGRNQWPNASDVPPLGQQFERFGDATEWAPYDQIRLGVSGIPSSRLQLRSNDRMLQVQNGRLVYNWIGSEGKEYARYETIRRQFDSLRESFKVFLAEQGLRAMSPNQWEMTYINHLPKSTVWNTVSDWSKVFSFHAIPPTEVNKCRLESVGGNWVYEIEPELGRLHMQLRHGKDPKGTEILIFNLTARGPIKDAEGVDGNVDAGLNLGHEVIVNTFTELTSHEARSYWGQES
jgi:uncharacterized protein (TIGR04255 family)